MRYSIKLSYRGADFCGWQVQPDAPSVQQTLEQALGTLLRATVSVTGAGRTDTGVNAIGYIAHFDAAEGLDTRQLCYKLNAILPRSIAVHGITCAPADFHARFDAVQREYTYFLHRCKDPFVEAFSCLYTFPEVDFDAMNAAAQALPGRHDFRCFEKTGADSKTSVCTVSEAAWHRYTPSHLALTGRQGGDDYWYFRISADRFLRNMVRAVVGTLLEVGRGKRSVEGFGSLILPPDYEGEEVLRSLAGESVPGHALFLSGIRY
ncbi:MAG: tRNA pseudouridine(38-40) synthase TruA [Bacteroidales bacterium]|nr:tRNA pseudouridine(38-40) synthase TruA [Bacteroidales bacterium]